ncbi:MAG: Polyketide synthase PksR [Candidatus Erwinia impunctatus]|nr:Polyketide synthase PksR [Culicoides impunctatus]
MDLSLLEEEDRCVDALHQHYVSQMLQHMQLLQRPQEYFSIHQLMKLAGIPLRYRELMQRLLRDLSASGALQQSWRNGELCYSELSLAEINVDDWLTRMRAAGYSHLAQLIARTGPQLGAMLRGDVDPVSVVFPAASTADVEHMYREQPWSRYFNAIAAATMATLASHSEQPIAILEIGAGTGGTSHGILQALPEGSCEHYSYTDLGPLFLQRAREKFSAYSFINYLPFDMEQPALQQSLPRQQYDAIVAANVLHNSADLRQMLRNLKSVLKPGGLLLMREITAPKKLFDFVFGALVPPISDSVLRHGELFASQQDWQAALEDAGFVQSAAFPASDQPAAALGEQIIVARIASEQATISSCSSPAVQSTLTVSIASDLPDHQWSEQQMLNAALKALKRDHPVRLSHVQWYCDPQGASDPLTVSLFQQTHSIEAVSEGRLLFTAQLSAARVNSVDVVPRSRHLTQPWRQQGALYHWQWQPVVLPQSGTQLPWQILQVPASSERQESFFNQLQLQLASGNDLLLSASGLLHAKDTEHAASWLPGLLTVARHEYPQRKITLIDSGDLALDESLVARLLVCDADQLRWQDGGWYSAQLQYLQPAQAITHSTGCHVLVGGLSPLGLVLAQQLADQGAEKLVLLVRRVPQIDQQLQLEALRERGVSVIIDHEADIHDIHSFSNALARLAAHHLPIDTVWHLAGEANDMPIARLDWHTLQQTLSIRLSAAQLLDRWQDRLQPAHTVYYSSAATVLGPHGQAAHAAACGALEMLAQQRCMRGHDTLAVAWGYWQITESASAALVAKLAEGGMAALESRSALGLLNAARGGDQSVVTAMDVDWQKLARSALTADKYCFAALLNQSDADRAAHCAPQSSTASASVAPSEQPLERYVRETLAQQLNCDEQLIKPESNLV